MSLGLMSKFPHEDFRQHQKGLIHKLNRAIQHPDVDYILLEAPTGFGKTSVAGTVAAHNGPSYYLTEQKIHQDQLMEEFPDYSSTCKGRYNYCCGKERDDNKCLHEIPGQSCHMKPTEEKSGPHAAESASRGDLFWGTSVSSPCPYFQSKTDTLNAPIGCLNYSYFFNETYYSGDFGPRNVIIADEAHNIEKNMQSFLTFRIDDWLQEETGLELRDLGESISDWEPWILNTLRPSVEARLEEVSSKIEDIWDESKEIRSEILTTQDILDEVVCNINRFDTEYDSSYFDDLDWAVERDIEDDDLKGVSFTPVSIAPFAERFLFDYADTTILMSATILDFKTLARSLGIINKTDRMATFRFPSPFDPEIRPIVYYDSPAINHQNWGENFPAIAKLVDCVAQLPENVNEKGIIHSVSYNNEEIIKNNVSRSVRRRLMTHGEDDPEREAVLEEFKSSDEARILMSPGIYEGVDLKYDMSRFQIVPKVPYLSLGSKAVQYKQDRDPRWYQWRTVIRMVQSFGRSVRSDDDYAKTYILDGAFENLYQQNSGMFPDYIEDAMEKENIRSMIDSSYSSQY